MNEPILRGQTWRRKKDGRLVRVTRAINTSSSSNHPYFDVHWETVERPRRNGACFESYWRRGYVLEGADDGQ